MKNILFILLLSFSLGVLGQQSPKTDLQRIDSLETCLTRVNDAQNLKVFLELCGELVEKNSEKCMLYSRQALELARKLNRPHEEVQALIYLGRENSNLGNYFEGLQHFKMAARIAADENDGKGLVDCWNEIGITYFNMGGYEEAQTYYFQALKKAEEIGYTPKVIGMQNNIAIIYSIYQANDKALEWFNKLLAYYENEADSFHIALTVVNMAIIYKEKGEYEKGFHYLNRAIPIFTESGDKLMLASTLITRGDLCLTVNRNKDALGDYKRALNIAEKNRYERGIISSSFGLGQYFVLEKQYRKALEFFGHALQIALANQDKARIQDCYEAMAKVNALLGDYQKALDYTHNYLSYKDEIFNEKTQKEISELQIKYETEKKEEEIEYLQLTMQKQRRNLIILIGGVLVVFVLVMRVLRLKQVSLKRKNLILQQEKQMDKLVLEKMEAHERVRTQENLRLQEEMKAREEINHLKRLKYKEEINHKERVLAANALHVVSKNEILVNIKKSVESVLEAQEADIKSALKQLIHGIESNISMDQEWEIFKMHFEEVHQGFFTRLIEKFPELTTHELRFCAYLRLNLDTKEISRILNISVNAIEKRRYRLRKKLNLNPEDSFFEFLYDF